MNQLAEQIQFKAALLASLPSEWPENLRSQIRERIAASQRTVVVLDDDPTGTQTVHGVPVLTEWSVDSLTNALVEERGNVFYILTNSRSLPETEAVALIDEIGINLMKASRRAGQSLTLVSRSDSTLRGHFPAELDALTTATQTVFDAWLLIPFFLEGGRYTINNMHYVAEGEQLIPAAATPFARDSAFGYQHSQMQAWVEEKSNGRFPKGAVATITLTDLREHGPEHITKKLLALPKGAVCVVNAASYRDIELLVMGLLAAEAAGKKYLYRTAASFVQVRAGLDPKPLLQRKEMIVNDHKSMGGLIVVGSYVPKTTAQVNRLLAKGDVEAVEVEVAYLLDDAQQNAEIENAVFQADKALQSGRDVLIYTSRKLITSQDSVHSLAIGNRVSDSLIRIIKQIQTPPHFIVAKGGITSSDVATKGLGIKRALVLGQILPGIPVWQTGAESRYPAIPYIVFPGNVGENDALLKVVQILRG